jgi:hypothetical protein
VVCRRGHALHCTRCQQIPRTPSGGVRSAAQRTIELHRVRESKMTCSFGYASKRTMLPFEVLYSPDVTMFSKGRVPSTRSASQVLSDRHAPVNLHSPPYPFLTILTCNTILTHSPLETLNPSSLQHHHPLLLPRQLRLLLSLLTLLLTLLVVVIRPVPPKGPSGGAFGGAELGDARAW